MDDIINMVNDERYSSSDVASVGPRAREDLRSTWHFNLLLLSTTTSIPKTQQRENTRPSISPDTTAFNNQILFLCVVSSLLLPLFFGVYAVYVRIY